MLHWRERRTGGAVQLAAACVAVAVGALLLFVPEIQIVTLCAVFCAGLLCAGVVSISWFFLSKAYEDLYDLHFALGILLLILGVSGLLQVNGLAENFELALAFLVLSLGTIMLQRALQLRILHSVLWVPAAVLAGVSLLAVVPVLARLQALLNALPGYSYWTALIVGVLSVVSFVLGWIGGRRTGGEQAPQAAPTEDGAEGEEA